MEPGVLENEGCAHSDSEVIVPVHLIQFHPDNGKVTGVLDGALHLHVPADVRHNLGLGDEGDGGPPVLAVHPDHHQGHKCQYPPHYVHFTTPQSVKRGITSSGTDDNVYKSTDNGWAPHLLHAWLGRGIRGRDQFESLPGHWLHWDTAGQVDMM